MVWEWVQEGSAYQGLGVYQSERVENLTCLENYSAHSTPKFFAAYCDGVNLPSKQHSFIPVIVLLKRAMYYPGSIRCGELIVISDE